METTRSIAAAILPGDWAVLPALSLNLLRRSSIPVQSYAFWTGLCSADIPVNRKGVRSTATHAKKLSFYLDDWLLRNASKDILKKHEIVHQECQIGRMDYEPGEVGIDSFPGFHIHRDSL
jgi:hypothetical protein